MKTRDLRTVTLTSEALVSALKHFEGCRLEAYRCPGGVWTIGYGHTFNVRQGDKISRQWADAMLRKDIDMLEREVMALGVCRKQGELDALVSFAFNLGIGRLAKSTLLKVIREGGSKNRIRREFRRWVFANGKKLRGLEKRREWEARRFFE